MVKEGRGWTNFEGGYKILGFHKIGGRNPLPNMSHKEVFWKKGVLIVYGNSMKKLVKKFILSKVAS